MARKKSNPLLKIPKPQKTTLKAGQNKADIADIPPMIEQADLPLEQTEKEELKQFIENDVAEIYPSMTPELQKECDEILAKLKDTLSDIVKFKNQAEDNRNKESKARKETEDALKKWETEEAERKAKLKDEEKKLDEKQRELLNKEKELNSREESILKREADADAGFPELNKSILGKLQNEREKLSRELSVLQDNIYEEKIKWENEKAALKKEYRKNLLQDTQNELEQLSIRESNIEKKEAEFSEKQIEFEKSKQNLEFERKKIEIERNSIEGYREKIKLEAEQEFANEIERKKKKIDEYRLKITELDQKIDSFDDIRSILGDRSPEEILDEVGELKSKNRDLLLELERSGGAELQQRYEILEEELENTKNDLWGTRRELQAKKDLLVKKERANLEIEYVKKENEVHQTHKDMLNQAVAQIRNELGELKNENDNKDVFAEFMKIDNNHSQNKKRFGCEFGDTLADFVNAIQYTLFNNKNKDKSVPYFYSKETLQIFVGGLAMSRLHILQGISGTGKTSLVKLFAKIIGGDDTCQDVAVQAGWRDSQDLLGYYNSFEKKFYEKDFSIGLYRASSPDFRNEPFFILLDEMNLSHPEQYFADFLSELEKEDKGESLKVRLVSGITRKDNWPRYLHEDQFLKIPDNVWFIGTANHDETTMEFADKTYDRAHIMTLPYNYNKDEKPEKCTKKADWTFENLQKAFMEARNKYNKDYERVRDIMFGDFKTTLSDDFNTGWGNRLDRQLEKFVPVVCAAGGTVGLALDHILATKILRKGKVTGRFDVNKESIEKLRETVETMLKGFQFPVTPDRSQAIRILEEDIKTK
ncbi:MAG: hypothetical protein HQK73_06755 [Desulfamplus sp.]|nr:hypothetical protein [Desulfamplus sp.]